jgi:ATP-binding cassette subfamily F protein uup
MKPGDRIGIVGDNGLGKTTLVRTILGELPPESGKVTLGINTRISYLDQGRADLDDARTVLEEVAGDSDSVVLEDGAVHVRTFLRMMLFDDRFADTPVGTLSGGERNRVQLARLLRRGGNLLVLDEPTNDLDLPTLGVLEEALIDFPGCALVVSHDRWFLDRVATAILAFERGDAGEPSRVTLYEGGYSDYLAHRPPPPAPKATAKPSAPKPEAAKPARKKLSSKDAQELAGMEARIEAAEAEVARREAELADPELYRTRGGDVARLTSELEEARATVARLWARWEALGAGG